MKWWTRTRRSVVARLAGSPLDNLKRLQTQFVQSGKTRLDPGSWSPARRMKSIIHSRPFSDTPRCSRTTLSISDRARNLAQKIREQARRTKTLVNNLLSFARQVPSEQRGAVDINAIVNTAVQFRRGELRGKEVRIEMQTGGPIPEVRGGWQISSCRSFLTSSITPRTPCRKWAAVHSRSAP